MTLSTVELTTVPNPIDCQTAVRRLWDYLDGRLPATASDEVERHLATCERCLPHFEFANQLRVTLGELAPPPLATPDEMRLQERVRGALARLRVTNGMAEAQDAER